MPKIGNWSNLPAEIRQQLMDRMHDRSIDIANLNQLRIWIEAEPDVPDGDWYKDFGSFKVWGSCQLPKTFLLRGQVAKGEAL